MRCEGVEKRKVSGRISFTMRVTYPVIPQNLSQLYGEDPTCLLCLSPANLKHILVSSNPAVAREATYGLYIKTRGRAQD